MGLRQKIQRDLMGSGLPEDLQEDFHALSAWAQTLPSKYGDRIRVRLIDAASIEGFFKSLVRRFGRYPAFMVGGARYVGGDFARVDELIAAHLQSPGFARGSGVSTKGE